MTLNQKYRNSGSNLTFKEWLKAQQKKNKIDVYKNFSSNDQTEITIGGMRIKYIIAGIGLIIIGTVFINLKTSSNN